MLDPNRLHAALEAQRTHLLAQASVFQTARLLYDETLRRFTALPQATIEARIAHLAWPGAWPTAEWGLGQQMVIPFAHTWRNHQEARAWALEILAGVPVVAVDGSQIPPSRDVSLPLGLVQVGWFENPHQAGRPYTKDVDLALITADDLAVDGVVQLASAHEVVDWRRFQMETDRLITVMQQYAEAQSAGTQPGSDRPIALCFFDGSLILSFAQHLHPDQQRRYVGAVRALLTASEATQVPLVGYVDTSYAKDLAHLLGHLFHLPTPPALSDAALLRGRMQWGDRSPVWLCGRNDGVVDKYYDEVAFCYLQTTAQHPPARVEFPRWVLESGLVDAVLDLVRAECIVGTGYPYALETADALAVLTAVDREQFYGITQQYTERLGLPLRFSRKLQSKRMRRSS